MIGRRENIIDNGIAKNRKGGKPVQDFEEVYKTYFPQVYRYLLKLCKDEALAEEITQDTFFKVLKNIDSYRGDCKFSVWLCQIAKNQYYSYLKKNKRLADVPLENLSEEAEEGLEVQIANKEIALKIHEILHEIPEPYREVFWMRTFGELSFGEIAGVHKKSESWARVTYHRAKMMIRGKLE